MSRNPSRFEANPTSVVHGPMRARILAPITFAASILVAFFATELARADEIPEGYFGRFRFNGGNAERQALTREIDRVADQFGFFIRGIARRRMHAEIRPETHVRLTRRGDEASFQFDERRVIPCDGEWHTAQGANDEDGTGKCFVSGGRLRYNERYDDGRTFHSFTVSEDAGTLRMSVRITHPDLPDDVRYRLTYRRR